jgi:hypothetical protein
MGPIQTYPRGLLEVLQVKGLPAPNDLGETIVGTLDLLPFYGLSQQQVLSVTNAALAETGSILITVPNNQWWLWYGSSVHIVKTATCTSFQMSIRLAPASTGVGVTMAERWLASAEASADFTACSFRPPRPIVLVPGTSIAANLDMLAVDANMNVGFRAQVGVIG